MTAELTVAVTGLHLGENPQPGPGVIRSLREALGSSVRVVGLAYDAFDSSLHAKGLLDDAFMVPYPSAGPAAYLARLLEIRAQVPFDVLVPCLDVELPVLAEVSDSLDSEGVHTFLPSREQLARRSKEKLAETAVHMGVKTPDTRTVNTETDLLSAGRDLGYPQVLKGPYCDAEVVRSLDEAKTHFTRLSSRWGLPLLVQRYVQGEEYDVVCLGDGSGGMLGAVGMRKTVLTKLGKAWGAVTIDDPELIETARRIVHVLRWRGGCEVELLRSRDGELFLIEINPRFPAWVYLATAAGVNLPLGYVRLALNRQMDSFDKARSGVFYVRHATEATGVLQDLECLVTRGMRSNPSPWPRTSEALSHRVTQ